MRTHVIFDTIIIFDFEIIIQICRGTSVIKTHNTWLFLIQGFIEGCEMKIGL